MTRPRRSFRRVFRLGRGGRDPDGREVEEELAFHLARLRDDLVAEGWEEEEARAEARRRFGDPGRFRDACREERAREGRTMTVVEVVDVVRRDAGFALRQWMRQPALAAMALTTLVLGIGATAVVYALVDAVVLQPLPFHEPESLVRVRQVTPQGRSFSVSEPNFVDYRARQRSFTDLAALGFRPFTLMADGRAESVTGMRMSHHLPALLGMEPVAGRSFHAEEDVQGGDDRVVLLSEGAWHRRFGGDPDVLGATLELDGRSRTVVGVLPSDRAWPGTEVFVPLSPEPVLERDNSMIDVVGRLAPGVTLAQAGADMDGVAEALAAEYPRPMEGWGAAVEPMRDVLVGDRLTRLGRFLLGAVGLLLLMACASVSALQVVRATARLREVGVRVALGAGRGRILAQLAAEGALLGALGCAGGVALAYGVLPLVRRLGPSDVARLSEASIDATVLGVAVAATVGSVFLSGLAPALLVLRSGLFEALRAGTREVTGHGRRLRSALVATQFALAVVMVLGAALLVRSFAELSEVDLGFEPRGLLRFSVSLPDGRYADGQREDFLLRLRDAALAIPGVQALGATHAPPFSPFRPSNFLAASEREPDRQEDFVPVSWRAVAGDYFAAAGISLRAGRTFGPEDRREPGQAPDALPVVLDQDLADALFPGADAVGRPVTWNQPGGFQATVVGVVATARDEFVDQEPRPRIYVPYSFAPWSQPAVLVRTEGAAASVVPALREALAALDPGVPMIEPTPVRDDLRDTVAWPRFAMQVLSAFGVLSLLLAAAGIYGVTAFTVARRRREIGVRVALGADPGQVVGLVLRRALLLAAAGIAAGVVGALVLGRFLESLLYGVSPTDPVVFLSVPLVLAAVALLSALVPARRALRVDPRTALVEE